MPSACRPASASLNFLVNGSIHFLILATVLVLIYKLVLSKEEDEAFTGEINNIADGLTSNALTSLNTSTNGDLSTFLHDNQGILQKLQQVYSVEDPVKAKNNSWLFFTAGVVLVFILLLIVVFLTSIYGSGRLCTELPFILKESAVVFVCVGVLEYYFITSVAEKFLPIMPSDAFTQASSRLQQNLGVA